jgi:hypothetical protein
MATRCEAFKRLDRLDRLEKVQSLRTPSAPGYSGGLIPWPSASRLGLPILLAFEPRKAHRVAEAATRRLAGVHGGGDMHCRRAAAGAQREEGGGRSVPLPELPLRLQGCGDLLARLLLPHQSAENRLGPAESGDAAGVCRGCGEARGLLRGETGSRVLRSEDGRRWACSC